MLCGSFVLQYRSFIGDDRLRRRVLLHDGKGVSIRQIENLTADLKASVLAKLDRIIAETAPKGAFVYAMA